jgi:hypothetical protein
MVARLSEDAPKALFYLVLGWVQGLLSFHRIQLWWFDI